MPRRATLPASALALVLLLAGLALAARPPVQPVLHDGPFHARYDVVGRVVDAQGWPANQMTLEVGIEGLDGVRVEPVRVATSCYGDFGAVFDLGTVRGAGATVRVTVVGTQQLDEKPFNVTPVSVTAPVDRYHRLTQVPVLLEDAWPSECEEARSRWLGRVTLWGRAVRGVEEHARNGTERLYAIPIANATVRAVERLDTGGVFREDGLVATDARGDLKYSWTNALPVAGANVTVEVENVWANATMDPVMRVAFVKLATGVAAPPPEEPVERSRADVALVAIAAVAGVALLAFVVRK